MVDHVSQWILSLLIFFPICMAGVILLIPSHKSFVVHRFVALAATIFELLFSLHLVKYFVPSSARFQFVHMFPWLPQSTGISYIVGVDGLNLMLVLLTTVLTPVVLWMTMNSVQTHVKTFLALFLLLESSVLGVFVALDVVLFYVFWELTLIPAYFMIGVWGGANRIYATLKFFIYGFLGSVFLLLALIFLYYTHGQQHGGVYSSNLLDLYATAAALPFSTQLWLFCAVTFAFAIKVPVFPFYSWLIDTYEQAPLSYVLMSGILLKLAAYGLVRFSLCLFPAAAVYCSQFVMILAVIGILYGALVAWQQTQLRRMMAFSSLSHLGFIVLGIFSFSAMGLQGALYQMINHAITAAALFLLFQLLHSYRNSFELDVFGGLAKKFPWFAFFFVIAALGAVALPSTGSFVGEWLILMAAFQVQPVWGGLASLGVIFGAVYVLWCTYKILFGPFAAGDNDAPVKNLVPAPQAVVLALLSVLIFVLGFAAVGVLDHTKATLLGIEKTLATQSQYVSQFTTLKNGILVPLSQKSTALKGVNP
jgi:NADH-quinone oxidoreductase subunit M